MSNILYSQENPRQTENLDCSVALTIKEFKLHSNDLGVGKSSRPDLKTVIGRRINYKAKGASGTDWDWQLGSIDTGVFVKYWDLLPVDNSNNQLPKFSDKGTALIEDSSLPVTNSELGSSKGYLQLTLDNTQVANVQSSIFFDKNDSLFLKDLVYDPATKLNVQDFVPNWFYYWNNILQNSGDLSMVGMRMWDVDSVDWRADTSSFTFPLVYRNDVSFQNKSGANELGSVNMHLFPFTNLESSTATCSLNFRQVITDYDSSSIRIFIGDIAGHEFIGTDPGPGPGPATSYTNVTYKGIEGVYSTVIHEIEHWLIMQEFWQNGYDMNLDCDRDFYPDSFETSPIGALYGFDKTVKDEYNANYNPNNLLGENAATRYEEDRCRRKQISEDTTVFNNQDWSFDPSNKIQGKQWK